MEKSDQAKLDAKRVNAFGKIMRSNFKAQKKAKKNIKEQTGAGAAGATTTATFQPAVGPAGSASKSGSFPGGNLKRRRRKIIRRDSPAIKEAINFAGRLKRSSMGK